MKILYADVARCLKGLAKREENSLENKTTEYTAHVYFPIIKGHVVLRSVGISSSVFLLLIFQEYHPVLFPIKFYP